MFLVIIIIIIIIIIGGEFVPQSCAYALYIQGDSGGICNTLGNDSMCDSKQKSSYEHGSDFGRLRSYGYLLIPVHALV